MERGAIPSEVGEVALMAWKGVWAYFIYFYRNTLVVEFNSVLNYNSSNGQKITYTGMCCCVLLN